MSREGGLLELEQTKGTGLLGWVRRFSLEDEISYVTMPAASPTLGMQHGARLRFWNSLNLFGAVDS